MVHRLTAVNQQRINRRSGENKCCSSNFYLLAVILFSDVASAGLQVKASSRRAIHLEIETSIMKEIDALASL